jgi:Flp pilus assembly protein TadG
MISMVKQILKDKKGGAYIEVVIFFLVAIFMFCFIVQMSGLFVTKMQLDNDVKQIVKLTQLEGGVTTEVDTYTQEINNAHKVDRNKDGDTSDADEYIQINIDSENFQSVAGVTDYALQLGDTFTVTATREYKLGFSKGVLVTINSKQTGISERHWKELN